MKAKTTCRVTNVNWDYLDKLTKERKLNKTTLANKIGRSNAFLSSCVTANSIALADFIAIKAILKSIKEFTEEDEKRILIQETPKEEVPQIVFSNKFVSKDGKYSLTLIEGDGKLTVTLEEYEEEVKSKTAYVFGDTAEDWVQAINFCVYGIYKSLNEWG